MSGILKDPLVHFLCCGALLFGLDTARTVDESQPQSERQITVSGAHLDSMRAHFASKTGVAPSEDEEAALVGRFVDEEVLYREARAMGLDQDDLIVRRRLIQKMRFLTEDRSQATPTPEEVAAFVEANVERFEQAARVRVSHVFFGGPNAARRAKDAMERIEREGRHVDDAIALGDPYLRGYKFPARTAEELTREFGKELAERVMIGGAGEWIGPLTSHQGVHLVHVDSVIPGRDRDAADPEVRAAALRALEHEHRVQANRALVDELRERYVVHVEGGAS